MSAGAWRGCGSPLARGHGLGEPDTPGDMLPQLSIAHGTHARQVRVEVAARRAAPAPPRRNPPRAWHRTGARCARKAPASRASTQWCRDSAGAGRRLRRCSSESAPPGESMHLECALDALRVGGADARGGLRIDCASSSCSACQPSSLGRRVDRARGLPDRFAGSGARPCVSARKYSIVPPTSSGTRLRARIASISASASRRKSPGGIGSTGSQTSIR